jgi:uncharacterized protein (TIGR03435 family)
MPPDTTKEQFQLMLQNLLVERFHLAVRRETRDFPGYDLVVAPGGPKMKLWTPDAPVEDAPVGAGPRDAQGFPRLPQGQPGVRTAMSSAGSYMLRSTHRQSMADFAQRVGPFISLSNGLAATAPKPRVADKTGLIGIYEFKVEFEASSRISSGSPLAPPPVARGADAAGDLGDPGAGGPTVFGALEEQLGVRLVKTKGVPVDVIVIDHAEPWVNLLLAATLWHDLHSFAFANLVLGLANLVPTPNSDGRRIWRAFSLRRDSTGRAVN